MKKLTLVTLVMLTAGLVINSSAATFTITQAVTNLNPTMIVPPVDDAPDSWLQVPDRNLLANTNKAVTAGQRYRIGRQVIIAANAGNLTTTLATNVVGSTTNVTIASVSVPVTGLSAADGTVYWFRLRPATEDYLRLSMTISSGGGVILKDSKGDLIKYATSGTVADFPAFPGALWTYTDGTAQTNVINTAQW